MIVTVSLFCSLLLAPPTFPQVCVPPLFQVFENENLTLFCNVTAYPLATIRWFKNKEEIDSVLEPGTFKIIVSCR